MYEPKPEYLLGYYDEDAELDEDDDGIHFVKLPTRMEVCPDCHGKGHHVNRAIDGNGLSYDDPDLDDEFWENYRSGVYDVTCDTCHGRNVVEVVDEERCTPAQLDKWHRHCQDAWECHAIWRAETRMGA